MAHAATFFIKQGDLLPAIEIQCTDKDGVAVDLTGATGATFRWQKRGYPGSDKSGAATITDAVNGLVQYAWVAGDTDEDGDYQGEVIINWSGKNQTFPSGCDDYALFCIGVALNQD